MELLDDLHPHAVVGCISLGKLGTYPAAELLAAAAMEHGLAKLDELTADVRIWVCARPVELQQESSHKDKAQGDQNITESVRRRPDVSNRGLIFSFLDIDHEMPRFQAEELQNC